MTESDIRQALARAYCSEANKHKVVDPTLIEAMVVELQLIKVDWDLDRFLPLRAVGVLYGQQNASTMLDCCRRPDGV